MQRPAATASSDEWRDWIAQELGSVAMGTDPYRISVSDAADCLLICVQWLRWIDEPYVRMVAVFASAQRRVPAIKALCRGHWHEHARLAELRQLCLKHCVHLSTIQTVDRSRDRQQAIAAEQRNREVLARQMRDEWYRRLAEQVSHAARPPVIWTTSNDLA